MAIIRKIRTRIFLAVEGESEQSFVRLLQEYANQCDLNVHLECKVLCGGGYKTMLSDASRCHQRSQKNKSKIKAALLVVDSDRDEKNDDGWTLIKLKQEAEKLDFHVCVQQPNHEGLLYRMIPGNENKKPNSKTASQLLCKNKKWKNYQKPMDFHALSQKINLEDLLRVAKVDKDIRKLLSVIGFVL